MIVNWIQRIYRKSSRQSGLLVGLFSDAEGPRSITVIAKTVGLLLPSSYRKGVGVTGIRGSFEELERLSLGGYGRNQPYQALAPTFDAVVVHDMLASQLSI